MGGDPQIRRTRAGGVLDPRGGACNGTTLPAMSLGEGRIPRPPGSPPARRWRTSASSWPVASRDGIAHRGTRDSVAGTVAMDQRSAPTSLHRWPRDRGTPLASTCRGSGTKLAARAAKRAAVQTEKHAKALQLAVRQVNGIYTASSLMYGGIARLDIAMFY